MGNGLLLMGKEESPSLCAIWDHYMTVSVRYLTAGVYLRETVGASEIPGCVWICMHLHNSTAYVGLHTGALTGCHTAALYSASEALKFISILCVYTLLDGSMLD